MTGNAPQLRVIPGNADTNALPYNFGEDTKNNVFIVLSDTTELFFSDLEINGIIGGDDFNYSLYPVNSENESFYFVECDQNGLTDYAIVSESYAQSVLENEMQIGEDAHEIGRNENGEILYFIYAGKNRNSWRTLNRGEILDALGKLSRKLSRW